VVAEARSLTVEDFLALPDDGNRHEFVRGEVRSMPPPKGVHGKIEARLIVVLGQYLDERARSLGWAPEQGVEACERLVGFLAGGEFGMRFTLPDDPNQIRGADVAYIPAEQLPRFRAKSLGVDLGTGAERGHGRGCGRVDAGDAGGCDGVSHPLT
jgi:hypothetical protein